MCLLLKKVNSVVPNTRIGSPGVVDLVRLDFVALLTFYGVSNRKLQRHNILDITHFLCDKTNSC